MYFILCCSDLDVFENSSLFGVRCKNCYAADSELVPVPISVAEPEPPGAATFGAPPEPIIIKFLKAFNEKF